MPNIKNLIVQALAHTLKIENPASIKITDHLKDDLGLDSMSSLTFLIRLEETIKGFVIDPETLDNDSLVTVSSVTKYVENQLGSSEARA